MSIHLPQKKYFGDSHREAWHILTEDFKGIQARANHAYSESIRPLAKVRCIVENSIITQLINLRTILLFVYTKKSNWYLILQRLSRKTVARSEDAKTEEKVDDVKTAHHCKRKTIKICKDVDNREIKDLENFFSKCLSDVIDYNMEQNEPAAWEAIHNLMSQEEKIRPLIEKVTSPV